MPLDPLITKLTAAGFFPIRVEGNVLLKEDSGGRVFIGDLDEFIAAAKALKVDVIFVMSRALEEGDFNYSSNVIEDDNEEDAYEDVDEEPIHLPSVVPALSKFEQYIGQDCAYKLSTPMANDTLDFYTQEPWWLEFVDLFKEAIAKVEQDKEVAQELQRAEREAEQDKMLKRLRQLINDSDFVRLPTQKAMLAYALDKIPELEMIDSLTLQGEIQTVNAKIAAKGLSRKR